MPKPNGRPNGLIINRGAFEALCDAGRLRKGEVAERAGVSPSFLADLLAYRGGTTRTVADRIAAALEAPTSAVFPELDGWIAPLPDRKARRVAPEVA